MMVDLALTLHHPHSSFHSRFSAASGFGSIPASHGSRYPGGTAQGVFDLKAKAQRSENDWASFERTTPRLVRMRDVPFPEETVLRAMAQELGGGKKAYQTLAMRWHPDKFAQKFGSAIDEKERDAIYDKVKSVFQAINTKLDKK